jgi:hypothetical protein
MTRILTFIVFFCVVISGHGALAQTVLPSGQPLKLAWDAGTSQPPEESYKVRLLAQSSPTGVTITEIVTPTPSTAYDVPYASLPSVPFWVSVRALRTAVEPGESADSNVIGPFVTPRLSTPTGLRRVP